MPRKRDATGQLELFPGTKRRDAGGSPVAPRNSREKALVKRLEEAEKATAEPRYSSAYIRRLMTPLPPITVPWGKPDKRRRPQRRLI